MTTHSHQPLCNGAPRVQVIGYGPAALGIGVAADRLGLLDRLLDRGCVFLDGRQPGTWNNLFYDIAANTTASSFMAAIRPDGLFRSVLESGVGTELKSWGEAKPPLPLGARFLEMMAGVLRAHIARFPGSAVVEGVRVDGIAQAPGGFVSRAPDGSELVRSTLAVLAVGAEEAPRTGFDGSAALASGNLLMGEHHDDIRAALGAGRRIAVLGGSHSAWSVAEYLLRKFGDSIGEAGIQVVRRYPTRLYADARAAYVAVRRGRERRVQILECRELDEHADALSSALCISALGYRARPVAFAREGAAAAPLRQSFGNVVLNEAHEVHAADGQAVRGLFALGLGHAMAKSSKPGMRPDFLVAVKYFHNGAAETIVKQLAAAA